LLRPDSRRERPLLFPPAWTDQTVCAGGNERGDAFEEARRGKYHSECNERAARLERVGAFTLFAVAVSVVPSVGGFQAVRCG